MERYSELIRESGQLKSDGDDIDYEEIYYREPFYQLMRQMLWAEQIIMRKGNEEDKEDIQADDFIHVHVVPRENAELLHRKYKCSTAKAWRTPGATALKINRNMFSSAPKNCWRRSTA